MVRVITFFCLLFSSAAFASDTAWSDTELSIIKSLSIERLPALPASPSNRFANDEQAQALGKQIFFDTQFSGNKQLSCASCHEPDKYFTDGIALAKGMHATGRNTPTVVGSAWLRWFYWDGRKDSLWSQALIPFEAPNEMGASRASVVKTIMTDKQYRQQYLKIFGNFPSVLSNTDLSLEAGPLGDKKTQDNWYRLPKNSQQAINQVYVNIGKSLAAYQRTLTYKPTAFDRYVKQLSNDNASDESILDSDQIAGLKLFIDAEKTQCLQCHNTALLSNRGFHNVGSGSFSGTSLDFGRVFGLQAVLIDEFNCLGAYSDAMRDECTELKYLNKAQHIPLQGAFKTPGLRNISNTAPYFHDGRFDTLKDVVDFYNDPPNNNGPHELNPLELNSAEVNQLVRFLESLTEE